MISIINRLTLQKVMFSKRILFITTLTFSKYRYMMYIYTFYRVECFIQMETYLKNIEHTIYFSITRVYKWDDRKDGWMEKWMERYLDR